VQEASNKKKKISELKAGHVEKKNISKAKERQKLDKGRELIQEEAPADIGRLSEGIALLGRAILEIVCARLPDPKPPTTTETMLFSESLEAITAKHAPQLVNWVPEIMLAATTAAVILPRMGTEEQRKKAAAADAAEYERETHKDENGFVKLGKKSDSRDGEDGERKDQAVEAPPGTVA